jgi:pantoate--beta-alanine ligase
LSSEKRFALDYAEIVDGETFEIASETTIDQRAIVAGWINGVRLIDTMSMNLSRVNVLVSP